MFLFSYCAGLVPKSACKMEEKEEDHKCVSHTRGFVA